MSARFERVDLTGLDVRDDPELKERIDSLMSRLPDASMEFSGFFVRPGDTLIVRVPPSFTSEEFAHVRAAVTERLDGIDVVIMNAEQVIAYRPGGDE